MQRYTDRGVGCTTFGTGKNTSQTSPRNESLDPELAATATEHPVMKDKKGVSVWGIKRKPLYGGGMANANQSSWARGYGQGKLW